MGFYEGVKSKMSTFWGSAHPKINSGYGPGKQKSIVIVKLRRTGLSFSQYYDLASQQLISMLRNDYGTSFSSNFDFSHILLPSHAMFSPWFFVIVTLLKYACFDAKNDKTALKR